MVGKLGANLRVAAAGWEREAALLLTAVVFSLVQGATANIIGIDAYYHIKVAALMLEQGPRLDFPWLQLTILGPGRYTDHHFLFHLLQAPFTMIDLRIAAKLAAVLFATLGLFTCYAFFAHQGIRYPLLWLGALLACSPHFLWRQSMARPQALSLALLVAAIWVVFHGRPRLLVPIGFLAAWLFDGFPFVVGVPAAALAAQVTLWLVARVFRASSEAPRAARADGGCCLPSPRAGLAAVGWATLGIGLGVLTHPYVPNNIEFAYLHLAPKTVLGGEDEVRVGGEWYPYSRAGFLTHAAPAAALTLLGLVPPLLALLRGRRPDWRTLTLGALALGFLVMVIRSQRIIEYFPAFAVLFCAWSWSHTPLEWGDRVTGILAGVPSVVRRRLGWWPLLVGGMIALALVSTTMQARRSAGSGRAWTAYREPALWLAANTPPGVRVFNTDWDDFTHLFFWNTHNVYLVGLDPTYMSLYDSELFNLWRRVSSGQVAAPSQTIRETFGAEYVFSDLRHTSFLRAAAADPAIEEVARNSNAVVLRIRDGTR